MGMPASGHKNKADSLFPGAGQGREHGACTRPARGGRAGDGPQGNAKNQVWVAFRAVRSDSMVLGVSLWAIFEVATASAIVSML